MTHAQAHEIYRQAAIDVVAQKAAAELADYQAWRNHVLSSIVCAVVCFIPVAVLIWEMGKATAH